jgi:hypothetical protein
MKRLKRISVVRCGILKYCFLFGVVGEYMLNIVFSRTKGVMHPFNPAHPFLLDQKSKQKSQGLS